jgi:hypothetical protein
VRVIVALSVPGWTKNKENKQSELARRRQLLAIQDQVFAELAGTQRRITRYTKASPTLALEVDADALAKLERSPLVIQVSEDASIPMYPGGVEVIGPVEKEQGSK